MSSTRVPAYLPTGGHFEEGNSEYVFECPACGGSKFHWNVRKAQGFCFNCGLKVGSPSHLSRVMGRPAPLQEKKAEPEARVLLGDPVELGPITAEAAAYLATRRVPFALAQSVGFRFSESRKRIYAPIWSPFAGHPPSYKSRSILPGEKGWMSMKGDRNVDYLFGEQDIPEGMDQIVLVEGVFDVLTPGLWGQAWALLGSNLGSDMEYWLMRQRLGRVILLLDPDKTGMAKAKQIESRLVRWGMRVDNLTGDYPEPGSCLDGELDFLRRGL